MKNEKLQMNSNIRMRFRNYEEDYSRNEDDLMHMNVVSAKQLRNGLESKFSPRLDYKKNNL